MARKKAAASAPRLASVNTLGLLPEFCYAVVSLFPLRAIFHTQTAT